MPTNHYWQVTEADFEQAIGPMATDDKTAVVEAAQNAAQSVRAAGSLTLQGKNHHEQKTLELQGSTTLRDPLQFQSVGDTGFEPVCQTPRKTAILPQGGAESDALGAQLALEDPDLAELIQRWEGLPEDVQAGVLVMLRGAGDVCR